MKKMFILTLLSTGLVLGLSGCGKKSNPIVRDQNDKVIEGQSFPPPYGAQVQE